MSTVRSRGFTLIELLVVIAIIGILSSVVLASLNSARKKGRDARRIADVKQLQLAMELYYDSSQKYPVAMDAGSLVTTGFISSIPIDPSGGTAAYGYVSLPAGCNNVATACTDYALGAELETAAHSALSADDDGSQAITINGGATNCNANAANVGGAEAVYCVAP